MMLAIYTVLFIIGALAALIIIEYAFEEFCRWICSKRGKP